MSLNDREQLFETAIQGAVLDSLLLHPVRFRTCDLSVTDFGSAAHRAIFDLMNRLDAENALNVPALLRELPDEHTAALIGLDAASTTERAFERDCKKLRDLTVLRRQAALATDIYSCIDSGASPEEVSSLIETGHSAIKQVQAEREHGIRCLADLPDIFAMTIRPMEFICPGGMCQRHHIHNRKPSKMS